MLAQRTDEICRKFLTLIYITADPAAPDGLAGRSFCLCCGFGFDIVVIVIIGSGFLIAEHLHVGNFGYKKCVGGKLNLILYLG